MAVGDTITGNIRYVREETSGNRRVIFGPISSAELDHKADPQYSIYVNPSPRAPMPTGHGVPKIAGDAVLWQNEVLEVQHLSSSLEEAIDYDADEIYISIVEIDLQRGTKTPKTLTAADTELSTDPTSSTSSWVTFFKATVPSGKKWIIAGIQNVAAVEVA